MTLQQPASTTSSLIPESADRPGDDPIFTLHAQAVARAAAGEDILNATIGALMESDGSMAVMPAVFEAYKRIPPEKAAGYAPISGPPRYLAAVIKSLYGETQLAERSVAVATPGGTGAIHHAIVNFLEPGDELLTTSYYWGPYAILAEHTRRKVKTFDMFDAAGGFNLEAYERGLFESVDRQGRALVVLNTPCHNPTGYSLDEREWEGVVDITLRAADRGSVTFLLDYAYAMFAPPAQKVREVYAERLSERLPVLVAWTASKSFAQYGARIGSLVATHADPEERRRIANALGYSCRGTWSNCNHLGMLAITELFEDDELRKASEVDRDRLRELLRNRVDRFNELAGETDLEYPRYEGGFFVSIFTPDPEADGGGHARRRGLRRTASGGRARRALRHAVHVPRTPDRFAPARRPGRARRRRELTWSSAGSSSTATASTCTCSTTPTS